VTCSIPVIGKYFLDYRILAGDGLCPVRHEDREVEFIARKESSNTVHMVLADGDTLLSAVKDFTVEVVS
jgi:hypothetical protein